MISELLLVKTRYFPIAVGSRTNPGVKAAIGRFLYLVLRLLEVLDDDVSVNERQYGRRYEYERETNEDVAKGKVFRWVDLLEFSGREKCR